MTIAIRLDGVGKAYRRDGATAIGSLKGLLLAGPSAWRRSGLDWALRGVDLEVTDGETVGLVGRNGAGKSTLLRVISGLSPADEGSVSVRGRLAAMLELGPGFHPELTGRESALLGTMIAGASRRDAHELLDDVVGFSGLEDSIDRPLRTYSTGMAARLAFAIAVHTDPEVLMVDEVLAVGDLGFQRRCLERLRAFQRDGVTIVLVSHDPGLVAELCDRAVRLERGRVVDQGPCAAVLDRYERATIERTHRNTPRETVPEVAPDGTVLRLRDNRFGTQQARARVEILDQWGDPVVARRPGDPVRVAVSVVSEAVDLVNVQVRISRADGLRVVDTHTTWVPSGVEDIEVRFDRLDLVPGSYALSVGVYSPDWVDTYDYHDDAYTLEVVDPVAHASLRDAVLSPPHRWQARRPGSGQGVPTGSSSTTSSAVASTKSET